MRTSVRLDPDVAAAVEQLRVREGLGLSEAINALARRGMSGPRRENRFEQRTYPMGAKLDVRNIADVLETLNEL